MQVLTTVLLSVFFAMIGGLVGARQNRFWVGFVCGFFLGPFGVGIAWLRPHAFDKQQSEK